MRWIHHLVAILRYGGLQAVSFGVRRRLWFHREYLRYEILVGTQTPPPHPPASLDVRTLEQPDLERLRSEAAPGSLPTEFWRDPLKQRRSCYGGFWDHEIAAIAWIYERGETRAFFPLRAGEAEVSDVFTLPRFRGRRTFTHVLAYVLDDVAGEGVERVCAHVEGQNRPSRRAFETLGFKVTGLLVLQSRFGFTSRTLIPTSAPERRP